MTRVNFVSAALAAMTLSAAPALAADVQPGDYAWVGDGRTLAIAYVQNQQAKSFRAADGSDVPASKLDANVLILRAVHYRELAGQKFAFHAIAPMGKFSTATIGGADQPVKNGLGDLTLGVTWFPMTSAEPTGTTFGISGFVTAPTGNYEPGHVSVATGGWSFTPQLGMVQGLGNGFFLDAAAEANIYRDFSKDGVAISQDTTYQAQAYLRYQWDEATAFSLGYTEKSGGDLFVNGAAAGQKTDFKQIRLLASKFVNPTTQVQLMLGKDTEVRGGFKNEPLAQVRFTKVF
ncbi:transporter [Falsigemmobacter faecalis]|uniref:Transporter n=1 Tax=Falsigemmobacter faecalis TaxID=2488730 RepID=A0A3P3DHY4_9RHOB|nr:transporter [Falsigemmobacter faecalis]RRH73434.1 transporter [Falsigemmobacter faecalis]